MSQRSSWLLWWNFQESYWLLLFPLNEVLANGQQYIRPYQTLSSLLEYKGIKDKKSFISISSGCYREKKRKLQKNWKVCWLPQEEEDWLGERILFHTGLESPCSPRWLLALPRCCLGIHHSWDGSMPPEQVNRVEGPLQSPPQTASISRLPEYIQVNEKVSLAN